MRDSRERKSRVRFMGAVIWVLALSAAPGAQAWTLVCAQLCNAATVHQSYGTGADDEACLAVCNGQISDCSNSVGKDLWSQYFKCVDFGQPAEICWEAYRAAKECSVCDQGQVSPWNPQDVVFVNEPACQPGGTQDGTWSNPYCTFHGGLDVAINRQQSGLDTKVLVCAGTYREGYDGIDARDVTAAGSGKVVVEAVTRGSAVISGSKDWSGAWLPQTEIVSEPFHNELIYSDDLTNPIWVKGGVGVDPQWTSLPPTFATTGEPVKVHKVYATNATNGWILEQQIPAQPNKLATFSIYIRPDRVTRFQMDFRLKGETGINTGAWYSFELPPPASCNIDNSSGAEGLGIEEAGDGWYRVHLTDRVDTPPGKSPNHVLKVRFHLVQPQQVGDGAEIFAPQLDHRPLDQFQTSPRDPLLTMASPVHATLSDAKTFYVNDSAQRVWTHDWGLARHHSGWKDISPLMRRAEMIFINDLPLRQELSQLDMEPGSFQVEDGVVFGGYNHKNDYTWISGGCSHAAPCPIRILPPEGVDMNSAKVEVAVQPRLLWLTAVRSWEIRGLTFQHSTGAYDIDQQEDCLGNEGADDCRFPMTNSAVGLQNSRSLTLLENLVQWNSPFGWGILGSAPLLDNDLHLLSNRVNDNGIGGEYFAATRGFTVEGEEFSRNNWRGRRARFRGHGTTGAKYSTLMEGSITGILAEENYGHGLWFDYENQALSIENCSIFDNLGAGVYFEANDKWEHDTPDPTTTLKDCLIQGNEIGISGISSSEIDVHQNPLTDNGVGISLIGTPREEKDGSLKNLREWSIQENVITASCSHQGWMSFGDGRGNSDYQDWWPVMDSLDSNENKLTHPYGEGAKGFNLKTLPLTLPEWNGCSQPDQAWCSTPQDLKSSAGP